MDEANPPVVTHQALLDQFLAAAKASADNLEAVRGGFQDQCGRLGHVFADHAFSPRACLVCGLRDPVAVDGASIHVQAGVGGPDAALPASGDAGAALAQLKENLIVYTTAVEAHDAVLDEQIRRSQRMIDQLSAVNPSSPFQE